MNAEEAMVIIEELRHRAVFDRPGLPTKIARRYLPQKGLSRMPKRANLPLVRHLRASLAMFRDDLCGEATSIFVGKDLRSQTHRAKRRAVKSIGERRARDRARTLLPVAMLLAETGVRVG